MVPLNLFRQTKLQTMLIPNNWSKKLAKRQKKYGKVNVVASSEDALTIFWMGYIYVLADADYVHITINNTIYGTRYTSIPYTGSVPLVTDASSSILSKVYDVSKFGLIYAGAQKNRTSELAIVIIRDDLIGHALEGTPPCLSDSSENGSV